MPEWEKVGKTEGHAVTIARVDGEKYGKISDQYNVNMFPTVLYFTGNEGDISVPYKGERDAKSIKKWLLEKNGGDPVGKAGKAKFVETNEEDFTKFVDELPSNEA